jgi:hypothetical protein
MSEQFKTVKTEQLQLPNGDLVVVSKLKGERSGLELINITKYSKAGRRGVTIRADAMKQVIEMVNKVM